MTQIDSQNDIRRQLAAVQAEIQSREQPPFWMQTGPQAPQEDPEELRRQLAAVRSELAFRQPREQRALEGRIGGVGGLPGPGVTAGTATLQADSRDLAKADIKAEIRTKAARRQPGYEAFDGIPDEQLDQVAEGLLRTGQGVDPQSPILTDLSALRIMGGQGTRQDISVVEGANIDRQQELASAAAQQLGRAGSAAVAAADTASIGLGPALRGTFDPELRGLEEASFQQRPASSLVGTLAGGVVPFGIAAGAGARGARAAAQAAGLGTRGRVAAQIGGGFAAAELAQAPQAFVQAVRNGGSVEEGLAAAGQAAAAYPMILGKVISGEELNRDDALNLAFLPIEYLGARLELRTALDPTGRVSDPQARQAIAEALQSEIAKAETFGPEQAQAAADAFRVENAGDQQTQTLAASELTQDTPTAFPDEWTGLEDLRAAREFPDLVRDPSDGNLTLDQIQELRRQGRDIRTPDISAAQRRELDNIEAAEEFPGIARDTGNLPTLAEIQARRRAGQDVEGMMLGDELLDDPTAPQIPGDIEDATTLLGEGPEAGMMRVDGPETATAQSFTSGPEPAVSSQTPGDGPAEAGLGAPATGQRDLSTNEVAVQRAIEELRAQGKNVTEKAIYDKVKGQGLTWRQVREVRKGLNRSPLAGATPQASTPPAAPARATGTPAPPEPVAPSPTPRGTRPPPEPTPPEPSAPEPVGPLSERDRREFEMSVRDRGALTTQKLRRLAGDFAGVRAGNRETLENAVMEAFENASPNTRQRIRESVDEAIGGKTRGRGGGVVFEESGGINPDSAAVSRPAQVPQKLASEGKLELADLPTPNNMIRDLAKAFNIGMPGIGKSRLLKTRALGWYRAKGEIIRLGHQRMLGTMAHEVGHHIHKMVFQGGRSLGKNQSILASSFPNQLRAELDAVQADVRPDLYPNQNPNDRIVEGWANFIKLLMTDPQRAKQLAPQSYQAVKGRMVRDFPRQWRAMQEFRRNYEIFSKGSPAERAATAIYKHGIRMPDLEKVQATFATWFLDNNTPMARMVDDVGGQDAPADRNPLIMARRVMGRISGELNMMVHGGRFDPANPHQMTGKGIAQILEPVTAEIPHWQLYMTLRRILNRRKAGFKGLLPDMSNEEIQAAIKQFDDTYGPKFEQAAKEFSEFNDWFIGEYAVHHGLLSESQAKAIRDADPDYLTFRPIDVQEAKRAGIARGRTGLPSQTSGVNRFKRDSGGLLLEPPLGAFMSNLESIVTRAQKNSTTLAMVRIADESEVGGRWVRKIDRPMEPIVMGRDDVRQILKRRARDAGLDEDDIDDLITPLEDLIDVADFTSFRPGNRINEKTGEFTVLVDGKPQFYEAVDPMLRQYLSGKYHQIFTHPVLRLLMVPRNVFRAGVTTLQPAFFAVNTFKDFFAMMVMSQASGKKHGMGILDITGATERTKARVAAYGQEYKNMVKDVINEYVLGKAPSQDFNTLLYKVSGADQAGFFSEYVDPSTRQFKTERMMGDRPKLLRPIREVSAAEYKAALQRSPLNLPGIVTRLNNGFELATRRAEFEARLRTADVEFLRKRGMPVSKENLEVAKANRKASDIYEAGQMAADVTLDFQRGGSVTRAINQFIPFFNASILGTDKIVRAIRRDPIGFAVFSTNMLVMPTVIEHLLNRQNEEYYKLRLEDRDRFWHIPMFVSGGEQHWFRVPKPYGIAIIPNMFSRSFAYADGVDPVTGKKGDGEAFRGSGKMVIDQIRPSTHVPVILPVVETLTNWSFFLGGEIVRRGEQYGEVSERGAERSSELAYALGGFLDMEPPKIDYLINGIFGSVGTDVNEYAISPLLEAASSKRIRRRDLQRGQTEIAIPILKRLIANEPESNTEIMVRYWDAWDTTKKAYEGWTRRAKRGDADTDQFYEDNKGLIEMHMRLKPSKSVADKLFRQIRDTYLDQDASADELEQRLEGLYDDLQSVIRDGLAGATDIEATREQ